MALINEVKGTKIYLTHFQDECSLAAGNVVMHHTIALEIPGSIHQPKNWYTGGLMGLIMWNQQILNLIEV